MNIKIRKQAPKAQALIDLCPVVEIKTVKD